MFRKLVFVSLCLLISVASLKQTYARPGTYTQDIATQVADCSAKFNSVCEKEYLFNESVKDWSLKKKYYTKVVGDFRSWLAQSNIIFQTLQPDEVQQNLSDFTQICQDFTTNISDFLFWVQGKTPPGGFSVSTPDAFHEEVLQHK